jgi:chitinase
MKFLKKKRKYYFQSLIILLMALSDIFACKATSTGPPPGPAPAPRVEEKDTLSGATIELSEGNFVLMNNDWGFSCNSSECDQAIILYTDGSYGWEWHRDSTGDNDPNYPEVLCGTKPWSDQTQATIFPIRIKDLNSCNADIDIVLDVSGDNWNLAFDFWFTEQKPEGNDVSSSITDEVMIWLRWGATHNAITLVVDDAIVDGENTYDYAQHYPEDEYHKWDYHQFRISGEQKIPPTINLKLFVDYIQDRYGLSDTLWITGMEFGNEYWDSTTGECRVKSLSYSVNGETVVSGSE